MLSLIPNISHRWKSSFTIYLLSSELSACVQVVLLSPGPVIDTTPNLTAMSPVVTRRMRPQSESGDANSGSAVRSSPKKLRLGSDEEDPVLRDKRELARTIAEFRIGLRSTSPTLGSSSLVTDGDDAESLQTKTQNDDSSDKDLHTEKHHNAGESELSNSAKQMLHVAPLAGNTSSLLQTLPLRCSDYHNQAPALTTTKNAAPGVAPSSESVPAPRANRKGFTASERELLEAAFHIADNPGTATMKLLVHLTGLDKKKIRGWFRTRRNRKHREEEKNVTEDTAAPSDGVPEPIPQIPPQYWPEPLRFSHMRPSSLPAAPFNAYQVPGYICGLPHGAAALPPLLPMRACAPPYSAFPGRMMPVPAAASTAPHLSSSQPLPPPTTSRPPPTMGYPRLPLCLPPHPFPGAPLYSSAVGPWAPWLGPDVCRSAVQPQAHPASQTSAE